MGYVNKRFNFQKKIERPTKPALIFQFPIYLEPVGTR